MRTRITLAFPLQTRCVVRAERLPTPVSGRGVNVNVIETDWHARRWGLKRPLAARSSGRSGVDLSTGSINVSRVRVKCRKLVDSDRVITSVDTDHTLERFAAPALRDIEENSKQDCIGSRECAARNIEMVQASRTETNEFVAGIKIDTEFPAFANLYDLGHKLTVVSDGPDRTVEVVLRRHGRTGDFGQHTQRPED